MSRWFRFYDAVVDDPKVQRLPPILFKFWVNSLCLASANDGEMPALEDMAFKLRMSEKQVSANIGQLVEAGLIDETEGRATPHNWDGRQFKSDDSKDRVKRHRDRHKKQDVTAHVTDGVTVTVTPPETEQIQSRAETEQKDISPLAASPLPVLLGPVFIELPTNRFETRGESVPIYEPFVEEMQRLYPAVDVRQQLRAMRGWLITNTKDRKTKTGMKAFITRWLNKQQDTGAPRETIRGNGNGQRQKPASAHDRSTLGGALAAASLGSDVDQPGEAAGDRDSRILELPLLAS